VTVGAVAPLVARRLRSRPRSRISVDDHPTVEMPTIEIPRTGRAALLASGRPVGRGASPSLHSDSMIARSGTRAARMRSWHHSR
jgi:hypothetical protein